MERGRQRGKERHRDRQKDRQMTEIETQTEGRKFIPAKYLDILLSSYTIIYVYVY